MNIQISLVGRTNLSREIYRQLRGAIMDGRLRDGDALPSSRDLARQLSVARMTVTRAYDRLTGEGFVSSRVGAGTFVNPIGVRASDSARRTSTRRQVVAPRAIWDDVRLSTAFEHSARIDLRTGIPDAALFPHTHWRRAVARAMRDDAVATGMYGHPAGLRALRDAIARHVGVSRGVDVSGDDVTITSGTQQAVDVIAKVLLAPGDRVAVEDPGYTSPRALLHALGMRVLGVPVDAEGLVVDAIPRGVRLVYVTPSHQYPLGVAMSLPRRLALLDWAERNNGVIVEDDYDSEFRFGGRPIEPIQSIDASGRVIYIGSFSKSLLPALRLGYAMTPPSLRLAIHKAKYVSDWHTSLLAQAALAGFIEDGRFGRHLRRAGKAYEARHALVRRIITDDLGDHLELIPSDVGLHVAAFARRASATQVDELAARAMTLGVAVQTLKQFAIRARRPGVMIGYGAASPARIREGLAVLRQCFEKQHRSA